MNSTASVGSDVHIFLPSSAARNLTRSIVEMLFGKRDRDRAIHLKCYASVLHPILSATRRCLTRWARRRCLVPIRAFRRPATLLLAGG